MKPRKACSKEIFRLQRQKTATVTRVFELMNVTGVIRCAIYIGHLHRTQFMAEMCSRPNLNSSLLTTINLEFTMERTDSPTQNTSESPANKMQIQEMNTQQCLELNDTSQKIVTTSSLALRPRLEQSEHLNLCN